jgi:hypothetical protein
MAQNASNVVVAGSGEIYVGAVGSTAPSTATAAPASAYTELGYITEEGATFNLSRNVTDVTAWESFDPIRKIVTSIVTTVTFNAEEWLSHNVIFAFGGGAVTGTTNYTYTPPEPDQLHESSLILDWHDEMKDYRLYFPRGLVTGNLAITLARTGANVIPVEFSPLRVNTSTSLFKIFTNDPAMVSVGS